MIVNQLKYCPHYVQSLTVKLVEKFMTSFYVMEAKLQQTTMNVSLALDNARFQILLKIVQSLEKIEKNSFH